MVTIAAIGLGTRTAGYLTCMRLFRKKRFRLTAVCDVAPQALSDIGGRFKVPKDMRFDSPARFFAAGKLADGLIIGTQDKSHFEIAKSAVMMGYQILLEKPVSGDFGECLELARLAKEKGVKIIVCHVLRYSKYYQKIKDVLCSGEIGELISIDHIENVGYFHFAHSYVRGDWHVEADSTPVLLAKCCHDIDLIQWFFEREAVSVSSLGNLNYFKKENAPKGAASMCMGGCKVQKDCPYDAEYLYLTAPPHKAKFIKFMPRKLTGKAKSTKAERIEAVRTGPYGRCVFLNDNDVCDHQTVSLDFGGGKTATHTMTAFSSDFFRQSHIVGTKGELICHDKELTLKVFGQYAKKLSRRHGHLPGHAEGDLRLATNFLDLLEGRPQREADVTFIETSLPSHEIIFAAERSRKNGGQRVKLGTFK